MPAIPLQQMDDFIMSNLPDYEKMKWEDLSIPLQRTMFKHVIGKAKPAEQHGALVKWDVQYDYDDNFAVTGLHDPDVSSRKTTLTQGQMFWSFFKTNYTYDLREDQFNDEPVRIIRWLDEKEHGLMNSFWIGMEKQMFGAGPTGPSPPVEKPPMCSLLWWLPPYNVTGGNQSSIGSFATGVYSDFLGCDPPGFSSVGTGGILRSQLPGWRHRVGTYQVFSEDDALDTIVECMDKCNFTPAQAYAELAPTDGPDWMLLTTYSRLKLARRISSSQNDNLKGNVTRWKDTVLISGVPMEWVPAWTHPTFGCQQTNGPVMGINWKTWKYYSKASLNMQKSPPERDKDNHLGRWRFLDHSAQLLCQNSRGNFNVTYGGFGSIVESA
jgi:hypothetical protein